MLSKIYRIKTNKVMNEDLKGALVKIIQMNDIGIRCECLDKKLKKKYGTISYYFTLDELEEVKNDSK